MKNKKFEEITPTQIIDLIGKKELQYLNLKPTELLKDEIKKYYS
ncbi:hypothetical protein [Psychroserpens sp. NJDZ02]|nr:hypothetical protein [Psychroserpens sp. NJDZ02]